MGEINPEYYGLDRFDLLLNPIENFKIYAGRKDLIANLEKKIDKSFKTGSAMHTVLWGPYGTGKTHTLYYIANYIERKGYSLKIIHITCPSLEDGSVIDLYQAIMFGIGKKTLYDIFQKIWNKAYAVFESKGAKTDIEKVEVIHSYVDHRDLAAVILYLQKPSTIEHYAWKWATGEKCSAKEKEELGVIKDNSDSKDAIKTLIKLIEIYMQMFEKDGKKGLFILMLDELENLQPLGEAFDFIELFRRLAECREYFVMLLAYTAAAAEAVPVLNVGAVQQRLGYPDNYISIDAFNQENAKNFISELFRLLRPRGINLDKKLEEAKKVTNEIVVEKYYPFSEEAIDAIITNMFGKGVTLCPRTLEMAFTEAIGDALTQDKPPKIISTDILLL